MDEETRNQRLMREAENNLRAGASFLNTWGHAHTFFAGLIIGGALGFIIAALFA